MFLGIFLTILTIIVILLLIFLFFYPEIRTYFERKNYRQKVYKILYYYAEEKDFLLINNVAIDKDTSFDHILFGDKYVYIIKDISYQGALYGNSQDKNLLNKNKKGQITKIENPSLKNKTNIKSLLEKLNIKDDSHIFVSVVCCNNSLILSPTIQKKEQGDLFLKVKDLEKTIKEAEKDKVMTLDSKGSEELIQYLKKISDKNKE